MTEITDPAVEAPEGVHTEDSPPEAAKYRRQLREVEAERDGLLTQLEGIRRTQAERLAGAQGLTAAALWGSGANLADLLAEDGTVDPQAVQGAVKTARLVLGIGVSPTVHAAGKLPPIPWEGDSPAFDQAFKPNTTF